MTEELIVNTAEAVDALGQAFIDYKKDVDRRISSLSSTIETKSMKSMHNDLPLHQSGDLLEYVKKGHSSSFNVVGGYSVLPRFSLVDPMQQNSLIKQLANRVEQNSGSEHVVLSFDESQFSTSPDGELKILSPNRNARKLHAIETAIFLESNNVSDNSNVANLEQVVQNHISQRFASLENELFISDGGVSGSIDGIGNLKEGYDYVETNYAQCNKIYDILFRMEAMLGNEYHDNAVWLMSPKVFAAIRSLTDKNGQFIVGPDSKPILLGKEVHCHQRFDNTSSDIILSNVQKGYTVIEYSDILALHDRLKNRAGVTNYFKRLIAGSVTDKKAWVSLKITDLPKDNPIQFNKSE